MSDFLETFSIVNLGTLRTIVASGTAANNTEIVPGIYLSWDDTDLETAIAYESPDWAALSLDCRIGGTPRWLSLNLALAEGRFEAGDVIGLLVEGYADDSRSIALRLRSKIGDGVVDTDWEEAIALHPHNGVSAVLCSIKPGNGISGRDGYHTLVLGLPARSGALTLRNLRVFFMPGSPALQRAAGIPAAEA
jgi:hypothetical protein